MLWCDGVIFGVAIVWSICFINKASRVGLTSAVESHISDRGIVGLSIAGGISGTPLSSIPHMCPPPLSHSYSTCVASLIPFLFHTCVAFLFLFHMYTVLHMRTHTRLLFPPPCYYWNLDNSEC